MALEILPAAQRLLGSGTRVKLVSGKDVYRALFGMTCMLPAVNVRLRPGLEGIMRAAKDKRSALIVEAAMSEVSKDGPDKTKPKKGYSGMNPEQFGRFVVEAADRVGFDQPLIVHVDHTTIQKDTPEAIEAGREQLGLYLADGIAGSYSIDASFLPLHRNVAVTAELARPILAAGYGLEVEVGEIGNALSKAKAEQEGRPPSLQEKKEQVTTIWEVRGILDASERAEFIARYGREPEPAEEAGFIPSLLGLGVHPDLLAIDNGSKHGNYKPGEEVSIFLGRTREVADAIYRHGIAIAQHGITGTPPELLYLFISAAGIRKGNVGTEWQNQAHARMDPELFGRMNQWAKDGGFDIKHATKMFIGEIEAMEQKYVEAINQATYGRMLMYIDAFKCAGSGPEIVRVLGA